MRGDINEKINETKSLEIFSDAATLLLWWVKNNWFENVQKVLKNDMRRVCF